MKNRSLALIAIVVMIVVAIVSVALRTTGTQTTDYAGASGDPAEAASSPTARIRPVGKNGIADPAESKAASGVDGKPDWSVAFYQRRDLYDFVVRAAKNALAGDGEAAYYVAQSVMRCFGRERDAWNAPDPEAAFVAKWAKYPNAHFAIETDRQIMQDCLRYVREDAFAALPARDGGYNDPDFWKARAYESETPRALAQHTLLALARGSAASSDANSAVVMPRKPISRRY